MLYLRVAFGAIVEFVIESALLDDQGIVLMRASLLNTLGALLFKYWVLFAEFACVMLRGGFCTPQGHGHSLT